MFDQDVPKSDFMMMTVASILLTIPFIYYAKDMADSLRVIAEKTGQNS